VQLGFRRARPAAGLVIKRPQLGLGRRFARDDLAQARNECKIELVW